MLNAHSVSTQYSSVQRMWR